MELLLDNGILAESCTSVVLETSKCWSFTQPDPTNRSEIGGPCPYPAETCCKKTIIKDANGNWVVTGTWSEADPDCVAPCFNVCNDTYYKTSKFNNNNLKIKDEKVFLVSNGYDSYINISINFSGKGNVLISDINGNSLLNIDTEFRYSTPFIISLNNQNYTNLCFYKITLDDGRIITGKLIK